MKIVNQPPSKDFLVVLNALQQAVSKELEKKKRLGQYAVFWEDGKPVLVGEDAPQEPSRHESDPA